MFELPVERTPDRIDLIRTWVPRVVMGMFFISMGSQKFTEPYWVGVFETIGMGDWLRYVTGGLQLGGALLLLAPRTALVGAAMLATALPWRPPPLAPAAPAAPVVPIALPHPPHLSHLTSPSPAPRVAVL